MKRIQFIFLTTLLLLAMNTNAQISVNISLGSRPVYHPPQRYYYDDNVDYYFLPEIEAYFDNREGVFIYFSSRGWVRSAYLPRECGNYDINRGVKFAIEYRGNCPYDGYKIHKQRYCKNDRYSYNDDDDHREYKHCKKEKHHKKEYRDHDDD
jgi:hypothetical protein